MDTVLRIPSWLGLALIGLAAIIILFAAWKFYIQWSNSRKVRKPQSLREWLGQGKRTSSVPPTQTSPVSEPSAPKPPSKFWTWVMKKISAIWQPLRPKKTEQESLLRELWRSEKPILIPLLTLYAILIFVGYWYSVGPWKWWVPAFAFSAAHFFSAIKVIQPNERAVSIILGRFVSVLESGPHLVPWPIYLFKTIKGQVALYFGTYDPTVDEADDAKVRIVKKQPVRINWGEISSAVDLTDAERKTYDDDPLSLGHTTDPQFFVLWRYRDLKAFYVEVGTADEAAKRIIVACESATQDMAGRTILSKARGEIDKISQQLRAGVERLVGDKDAKWEPGERQVASWGIDILQVRVKDLGIPHGTNTALVERGATIAKSQGEAKKTRNLAEADKDKAIALSEGEATRIRNVGAAEKDRLINEGEGRAAAMAALAKVADTPGGQLIVRTEAWKAGLEHGKAVIVPAEMSLMTGLLSAQAALKAGEEKLPTPPESK